MWSYNLNGLSFDLFDDQNEIIYSIQQYIIRIFSKLKTNNNNLEINWSDYHRGSKRSLIIYAHVSGVHCSFEIKYNNYDNKYYYGLKTIRDDKIEIEKILNNILHKCLLLDDNYLMIGCCGLPLIKICDECHGLYTNQKLCLCKEESNKKEKIIIERNEHGGFVYFLGTSDYIKIGFVHGNDPSIINRRLNVLKTGMPFKNDEIKIFKYISGNYRIEKEFHHKFEKERIRKNGEWFYNRNELKIYLDV